MIHFIALDGQKVNVMDDPDNLICQIVGAAMKHALLGRATMAYSGATESAKCEMGVENIGGITTGRITRIGARKTCSEPPPRMLPISDESTKRFPVVTVLLILANLAVFFAWQIKVGLPKIRGTGGIGPYELHPISPRGIEHLFTSMFMHGGIAHLLGNMWFSGSSATTWRTRSGGSNSCSSTC